MQKFFRFILIPAFFLTNVGIAQNFVSNETSSGDSTIHQINKSIQAANTKPVPNSSQENSTSNLRHSLAFKNGIIEDENTDHSQKQFESVSLNYMPEYENSLNNVDQYQMIDGTYWREKSDINTTRLYSVLGTMLAIDLIAYNMQRIVWRQNRITGFHSINWWIDVHGYQRMDKIGHFQDAYFVSDLTSKAYRWCGISGESSIWYGALTGWAWMLEIEISDGLFADWGFSWLDLSSNTIGSGFFLLQHYFPEALGGIHPKFSYHVSPAWREKKYVKDPRAFIEDYEGMTFWLAVNPYHYFPDSWKKSYPKWLAPLGVAVGYGAADIASFPQYGKPIWYFSLALDLRQIPIGDDSGFFKFLKSEFNFLKFPLPTVRVTPGEVWYGLYF